MPFETPITLGPHPQYHSKRGDNVVGDCTVSGSLEGVDLVIRAEVLGRVTTRGSFLGRKYQIGAMGSVILLDSSIFIRDKTRKSLAWLTSLLPFKAIRQEEVAKCQGEHMCAWLPLRLWYI